MTIKLNVISSIGLILDIIGAIMLLRYGLPSKIREHGGGILMEESEASYLYRMRYNQNIVRKANIGTTLLVVGFIIQLIGTNIAM